MQGGGGGAVDSVLHSNGGRQTIHLYMYIVCQGC